jgi:phytoene dehydrogenase-like protein
VLPLTQPLSSAMGVMFALTAHVVDWPVAEGGSRAIWRALVSTLESLGGRVETGRRIERLAELPSARVLLFDTSPDQLARIAGDALPAGYRRRLGRYRYGPGAFKLDWALDGPIPWRDPSCREASTVHVGGTLAELCASERDMYAGRHSERPFLILCQQSEVDPTRAPAGQHTGYAYCHVPHGSTLDMTNAIERQIERVAPGFRDRILARHAMNTWFERENCTGRRDHGASPTAPASAPVTRLDPYTTPNPRLFICSAATPPGGGVHGQCGYWAAQSVLKRLS